MALGKKCGRKMQRGNNSFGTGLARSMSFGQTSDECVMGLLRSRSFGKANEPFEMGFVRSTSFGRKRVSLTVDDIMEVESFNSMPSKKQCSTAEGSFFTSEKSALEALPQDILIRILCGVEHDDLKSLFQVSRSIREATLIVKQWHFAYSTPKKRLRFRNALDVENLADLDEAEAEAAQAPKQSRIPRSQLSRKKLADISVALFTSDGENWPRRELFMEMETEI